jgi:hypothetical protein
VVGSETEFIKLVEKAIDKKLNEKAGKAKEPE